MRGVTLESRLTVLEIHDDSPLIISVTWKPVRIEPSSYGLLKARYKPELPNELRISEDLAQLNFIRHDSRGMISEGLLPEHSLAIQEQYKNFEQQCPEFRGRIEIFAAEESDFASSIRVFQFLTVTLCLVFRDLARPDIRVDVDWLNNLSTSAVLNVRNQHLASF